MPAAHISVDVHVAQEILIALRDRFHLLCAEVAAGNSGEPGAATIAAIARRQMERVETAGYAIAAELNERF